MIARQPEDAAEGALLWVKYSLLTFVAVVVPLLKPREYRPVDPEVCALKDVERSPAHDWVTIMLPVSKAEEMLGTEYAIWEHIESQEKIVRTVEYSLPELIHRHGK